MANKTQIEPTQEGTVEADGGVETRPEFVTDSAEIFRLINQAREQAGMPKDGVGLFIGRVPGVGFVISA